MNDKKDISPVLQKEFYSYLKWLKKQPLSDHTRSSLSKSNSSLLGVSRWLWRGSLPQELLQRLDEGEQKKFLRAVAGCKRAKDHVIASVEAKLSL